MNVSGELGKQKRCYCNCDRCLINKGKLIVDDTVWIRKCNKNNCCKACKLKFENSGLQKNSNESIIKVDKRDIKKRLNNMINGQKESKSTSVESKRNTVKQGKENVDLRGQWNSSTKVAKLGKPEMEEKIQKRLSRKIKTELEKDLDNVKCDNVKIEKKIKKEKSKGKSSSKEKIDFKEDNLKEGEDTIYISYAVKGYLKIKPKNEVEVLNTYYDIREEMCEGSDNVWMEEEIESNEEEFCCRCCECINELQEDCFLEINDEESCLCERECLCVS